MTTTFKTITVAAFALVTLVAAPQIAFAGDDVKKDQTAAINYKPMYVQVEPDNKETMEEIEKQFASAKVQKISDEEMGNLYGSSDDDC